MQKLCTPLVMFIPTYFMIFFSQFQFPFFSVSIKKYSWFLILNLCLVTLLNWLSSFCFGFFPQDFYVIKSFLNGDSFTFSFPTFYFFFVPYCTLKVGHPCLVPNLRGRGKVFSLKLLSIMLGIVFSYIPLILLRKSLFLVCRVLKSIINDC